ncbi:DNA translocase FtsK [Dysgonomonas sp. OttesenSCG-928-M03]|nr:DNA translocase FtsK [Dysgonomonas sp. OttesenSCG-928-M03]
MPAKKNKTRSKKQSVKKESGLIAFFKNERTHFLLGVCVVFVALYIFIGMISFFFTGAADQSKVMNKYFIDLISHKQEIDNWTGVSGAFVAEALINKYYGIFTFVVPLFLAIVGIRLMGVRKISLIRSFILCAFALIWGSITSSFILTRIFPDSHVIWGGHHGQELEQLLENSLGSIGVVLIILLLLAIFLIITKRASVDFFRRIFQVPFPKDKTDSISDVDDEEEADNEKFTLKSFINRVINLFRKKEDDSDDLVDSDIDEEVTRETNRSEVAQKPQVEAPSVMIEPQVPIQIEDDFEIVVPVEDTYEERRTEETGASPAMSSSPLPVEDDFEEGEEMEDYDPTKDLSNYHFPSTELLKVYDTGGKGVDMEEQRANKEKIITTLRNYGIEITSIKATVGPTITLYEIVPQAGVRISKIRNLEDDIALSLSALGIRIIAPMPGKGTIGIEVPNKDPQIVSMQSVIASARFNECPYDLPVALGKTITNEIFMFDLCKMPHLLVAGATGQGKSVGLNAIITSLLYKKHPAEMKMVLVDPKMVEFNIYSVIEKHYLAKLPDAEKAIITDVTKVTQTLNSLTKEMDDRYELLMAANVRTIKEYNEKFKKRRLNPLKGHRFLPYIVVIIDEFGDLIMTAGKEIEMPIARIAQKARAVGIHMIIATQRPTTNIITGTIKANFPARMAFRVTSQIDSRTILDMSGANQLIGRGDMLFSQGSDLVRIQCAFVDTPEVEGITQYISHQQGYSEAFPLPEYVGDGNGDDKVGSVDLSDKDPLFEEAARLIVVHQQGSTSLIQRKFSIGYNRAGRLMDQLEAAGIVGPTQGSKPRDVMIVDEYSLEQKLNSI